MSGAFLMAREIFGHEIWQDVAKFRIFFYIVGNAVYSEQGVSKGGIQIRRGQYLRSYRKIREDLFYIEKNAEKYYSLHTIKSKIDELVEEEALLTEETKLGTLFTVVNYQHYQGFESYKKGEIQEVRNGNGTATEQQTNSNGTATEQQRNNKNYVINAINVNKDLSSSSSSVHPLIDLNLKSVMDFHEQQFFGIVTPHVADKMAEWINDTSKDLVIHAMKLAIESGVIKWSYAEGILKNWSTRKLETLEQVEAFELQRKQQKATQQRPGAKRQTREEAVPEWFANRQGKQPATKSSVPIDFDVEAERRRLLQELGMQGNAGQ